MKKLLGILVLGLLMCSKSYAELQIFTISCEGTVEAIPDKGPRANETYYEDLEIYVGNGKKVSTIKILPSHWFYRSDTYIPTKSNDPKTGWGNLIIFDVRQSILVMESPNVTSKNGKDKLLYSNFRLSLVNNSLMGDIKIEMTTVGEPNIVRGKVKSKCIGTEKIKKYLNIN